jgi:hypothetical protein
MHITLSIYLPTFYYIAYRSNVVLLLLIGSSHMHLILYIFQVLDMGTVYIKASRVVLQLVLYSKSSKQGA